MSDTLLVLFYTIMHVTLASVIIERVWRARKPTRINFAATIALCAVVGGWSVAAWIRVTEQHLQPSIDWLESLPESSP